ncbi:hypothetical protein EYF80_027499 [Liparis tanakae]|uniref:Uncharacterized protein n=1 Tax=Liparis tanakae TaxID=230148 RepID=A0A4Z2HAE2_9TELE|nr:hypothetical protein EYF80_027499 [Liparis tanakae]
MENDREVVPLIAPSAQQQCPEERGEPGCRSPPTEQQCCMVGVSCVSHTRGGPTPSRASSSNQPIGQIQIKRCCQQPTSPQSFTSQPVPLGGQTDTAGEKEGTRERENGKTGGIRNRSFSIRRAEEEACPVLFCTGLLYVGFSTMESANMTAACAHNILGKLIRCCCGLLEDVKVKSSTPGCQPAVSLPNQVEWLREGESRRRCLLHTSLPRQTRC